MCKTYFSKIFIVLLVLIISNTYAQSTGKITGTVTDGETNSPLPGANVMLEGTTMGAATDSEGDYFIINIPPGMYNLEVRMMGYGTVRNEGIRVSVNRTVDIDVELKTAVLEGEVVTVTTAKSVIKSDQTSSIRNISSSDIEVLPVDNIDQIVQTQPGVVGNHFRGGRSNEVAYMIDGVMVTESHNREDQMVEVNPDVVEDIEIITGTFNAEYGNAMSGVVNIVTKEGGNKLQGAGSVELGNFLTAHKDKFDGIKDTDIGIRDYKMSLTGPVFKNKMNFVIDGRYFYNRGHLYGINRFNVDDYSDFSTYPSQWISEANGDSSYIPLNDREEIYLLGKLTLKPFKSLKTSLIYTLNNKEFQNYSHTYSFNPYGISSAHEKSQMAAIHINHMPLPNAFYELKLSYIKYNRGQYVFEDPLDSRYVHDFYSYGSGQWFSTGGQDKNHTRRTEETYRLRFDLTWQLHKHHSLKTGIDLAKIRLDQKYANIRNLYEGSDDEAEFEIDPETNKRTYINYQPEVRPDKAIYTDMYVKEPVQFAAYIQDKMEFESMVVNLGVRLDYFDPKTVYPTNWRNPANQDLFEDQSRMSQYPDVNSQYQISPRLGLSYKMGQTALLRFSYGHFLQIPPLNYYYQNHAFRVVELAQLGNPLLKSQKTIQYEIGLWQQLTNEMDLEIAVFYRDIYDLLSSKMVYTYSQIRYGLYDNKDYANARGLELKYQVRLGKFSMNTNYTFQYARGVADSPDFAFNRAGEDRDPVNKLISMEWDQRHTVSIMAGYNTQGYGASLLGAYHSGMPYSWQPITESPLALINLLPNNQYRPTKFNVDLQAYYKLFNIGNVEARITLLAYNIFDRLNENVVNSTTGRAYTGIIRPIDDLTHRSDFSEYVDTVQNPGMFAEPRSIKVGLGFKFK
ncbi:TonB-dependent receptor [candidate division KSB1 bacterium]|nr:TonB-dependent receptor [candidate division KSB1 bacterium]